MSDVKWIKITTDILNDEKIKFIDVMPDADGIFRVWIGLLTLAGKTNDKGKIYLSPGIPYTDEILSAVLHRNVTLIRMSLKTFENLKMIEILANGDMVLLNWGKHQSVDKLDKIREQTRNRQITYREKQKKNEAVESSVTVTLCDAVEQEQEQELDKINKNQYSKNKKESLLQKSLRYSHFFEDLWKNYPAGRGTKLNTFKAVSARLKEGVDAAALLKAEQNYAAACAGKEIKWIMYGEKFFGAAHIYEKYLNGVPDENEKYQDTAAADKKRLELEAAREFEDRYNKYLLATYGDGVNADSVMVPEDFDFGKAREEFGRQDA